MDSVVTKATLNAASQLGIDANQLGDILNLDAESIARMQGGKYMIRQGADEFWLALLFIRLFKLLDTFVGGDAKTSQAWLRNRNALLGAAPLEHMQNSQGLKEVVALLEALSI